MGTRHLTAVFVSNVKPTPSRTDYYDTEVSGFGLRLTSNGLKSWTVIYRHGGRMRRLTLGHYPTKRLADARREARQRLLEAANGLDPADAKRQARTAQNFSELAAIYLERHAKVNKKSWREDAKIVGRELLPPWRNRKAVEITRRDVIALLDTIVARGAGVRANRVRALISKIFNFGYRAWARRA